MVRYNGTITLPYPRAQVWRVMSDWTNLAAWDINITRSERVAGQPSPDGVGTKFSCTFNANGHSSDVDYACVRFDKQSCAQFVGTATLAGPVGFRSQDTLAFRDGETDGTTELSAEFDLKFRGLFSPLSFVMAGSMKETGPIVMRDIEKFVAEQCE